MKHLSKLLLLFPICFASLTSCVDLDLITFESMKSEYNLMAGDEVEFLKFESPQEIDTSINWTTTNMKAAKILKNRLIALDEGTANFKVMSEKYDLEPINFKVNVERHPLDKKYSTSAYCEVSNLIFDFPDELIAKYSSSAAILTKGKIFYPSILSESDTKFPLLLFSNGTNQTYDNPITQNLFNMFAANGFIIVGNNEKNDEKAGAIMASLEYMLSLNEDETSPFYNKIDTEKIGALGYSQGATGVFNSKLKYGELSSYIKSIVPICPPALSAAIYSSQFTPDIGEIGVNCPVFIISGTGSFDNRILSNEQLDAMFKFCRGFTVKGRITHVDHEFDPALSYMLAFFLYTFFHDEEAAKVFVGENPEFLLNNRFIEKDIKV